MQYNCNFFCYYWISAFVIFLNFFKRFSFQMCFFTIFQISFQVIFYFSKIFFLFEQFFLMQIMPNIQFFWLFLIIRNYKMSLFFSSKIFQRIATLFLYSSFIYLLCYSKCFVRTISMIGWLRNQIRTIICQMRILREKGDRFYSSLFFIIFLPNSTFFVFWFSF